MIKLNKGVGLLILALLIVGVFAPFMVGAASIWTAGTPVVTGAANVFSYSDSGYLHRTFYANGRYWSFYLTFPDSFIKYRTSLNGVSWSAEGNTTIAIATVADTSFDIFFDGAYFQIVAITGGSSPGTMYYRRGLAEAAGTITWSAAAQSLGVAGSLPSIAVSSTGIVYVAYNNNYNYLIKNTAMNGTWSTAGSFPIKLFSSSTAYWGVAIIPLASGHMGLISHKIVHIQTHSGSGTTLGSDINIGYTAAVTGGVALSSNGDTMYLVYATSTATNYQSYNYGDAAASAVVQITASQKKPCIGYSQSDGKVYIFWRASSTTINYAYGIGTTFSTGVWLTTSATVGDYALGADYQFRSNHFPISYSRSGHNVVDGTFITEGTPPPSGPFRTISNVATSDTSQAIRYQLKTFVAAGRTWLFYESAHYIYYTSSLDTVTWASPRLAFPNYVAENLGENFVVVLDSTSHVHMAVRAGFIYWNYGTPGSDGILTWRNSWAPVWSPVGGNYDLFLAMDSSGHDWITWILGPFAGTNTLAAVKNAYTDGSWGVYQNTTIKTGATNPCNQFIISLPANKMYFGYFSTSGVSGVYGKLWDGAALGGEETVTTSSVFEDYASGREGYSRSTIADVNGNIYYAYLSNTHVIEIVTRDYVSGTWSAPITIQPDSVSYASPSLSMNNGILSLYYIYDPTHIYVSTFTGSSWTTASAYTETPATMPTFSEYGYSDRLNALGEAGLFFIMNTTTAGLYQIAYTGANPNYLGPFYGSVGSGPIYFASNFTSTAIVYEDDLIKFGNMNMAGAGDFGTIGLNATLGLTLTVLEIVPADHILMQTSTVASGKNVTVYLPGISNCTVVGAIAYHWNDTTKLLRITAPLGLAQITLRFLAGSSLPNFYIPQWFIDQGGAYFGVTGLFTGLKTVMTSFAVWFAQSVINVVALITSIITFVFLIAGGIIYWLGAFVTFWVNMFDIMGGLFDGTTGPINIISSFNVALWLPAVPPIATIFWYDSIGHRRKSTGRSSIEILTDDIQVVMYWVGLIWEWSWLVFNFVYNTTMTFVSLLWSLIP